MTRTQLEHLIRAASRLTEEYEIVVIGSQSVLGAVPDAPPELLRSMEADIYPLHAPKKADDIDFWIGELSPFDERYGYYAQGVGPETATLPWGWQDRLVRIQNKNTDLKVGLCLHPSDLAASKLVAGRPKDGPFVEAMLHHGIVSAEELRARIEVLPISLDRRVHLLQWLNARRPPVVADDHR